MSLIIIQGLLIGGPKVKVFIIALETWVHEYRGFSCSAQLYHVFLQFESISVVCFIPLCRLGAEALGEKDTDDLPGETEQSQSIDSSNEPFTKELVDTKQVKPTSASNQSLPDNLLSSQSSSSSQPLSQDTSVAINADSKDVEIEDFDDDLIW